MSWGTLFQDTPLISHGFGSLTDFLGRMTILGGLLDFCLTILRSRGQSSTLEPSALEEPSTSHLHFQAPQSALSPRNTYRQLEAQSQTQSRASFYYHT